MFGWRKKARAVLNRDAFSTLVNGGQVTIKTSGVEMKIILQDIGFAEMLLCLGEAEDGKDKLYRGVTVDGHGRTMGRETFIS